MLPIIDKSTFYEVELSCLEQLLNPSFDFNNQIQNIVGNSPIFLHSLNHTIEYLKEKYGSQASGAFQGLIFGILAVISKQLEIDKDKSLNNLLKNPSQN